MTPSLHSSPYHAAKYGSSPTSNHDAMPDWDGKVYVLMLSPQKHVASGLVGSISCTSDGVEVGVTVTTSNASVTVSVVDETKAVTERKLVVTKHDSIHRQID